ALFFDLKGRRHREYLLAVLDRDHTARGEARSVSTSVDLVENRNFGIATAQEISVERVALPSLDRPAGSNKCLTQNLASEHALHPVCRALAAEDIDLYLLEIEEIENFPDR